MRSSDFKGSLYCTLERTFQGLQFRNSLLYVWSNLYCLPSAAVSVLQIQNRLNDIRMLIYGKAGGALHTHAELSPD